ncbi:MAG: LamG-like jellyroll fold domain-containing protein [Planctomycetota bacterium]
MKLREDLIDLYLDGALTAEAAAELNAWVKASPEHAEEFARRTFIHRRIYENLQKLDLAQIMQQPSSGGPVFIEVGDLDESRESFAAIIEDGEEPGVDPPFTDLAAQEGGLPSLYQSTTDALTKQKYVTALSYVLRHIFTPKRVAILATAAAVLLGVVLAIVFLDGDQGEHEFADEPALPDSIIEKPSTKPVVAFLTAERDAEWDSQPDLELRPGQQFSLTQGFAEITTASGAVVILTAPATFELTDNDNAIYLSSGRLFGRCETASSKGFLVSTPSAQILDIGTEFGVDVNEHGETLTHVFQGEVEVRPVGNSTSELIRLVTNQALAVDSDGKAQVVDAAPQRFVRVVPSTTYQTAVLASRPMCYWRGPIVEDTRVLLDNGWLGAHGQASGSSLNHPEGHSDEDGSGSLEYRSAELASSVTVPYREEFGFNDKGFSISAWCWIEPGHQDVMRILSTRVKGGGIGLGVIGRGENATGGLPASAPILTLFGKSDVVATTAMPEGRWTHLAVTVSQADQVRIYIDGEEVQTHTIPHPKDAGQPGDADTQPLMIGRNPFTGQGVQAWQGRLDEIAIFDRFLPLEEIQKHLHSTRQAP